MGRDDVFFLECGKNSTITSTVVRDGDGATDDDVTNNDDEANAGDAGGADKDRVGGTGGGDDASRAGRDEGSGGDVVQNDAGCDIDVS